MTDGLLHDNVHKPQGKRLKSTPIPRKPAKHWGEPWVPVEDVTIACPCCQYINTAEQFAQAVTNVRGEIVKRMADAGLAPKQIANVLGWKRGTVRSLLWYRRHVAKVKP